MLRDVKNGSIGVALIAIAAGVVVTVLSLTEAMSAGGRWWRGAAFGLVLIVGGLLFLRQTIRDPKDYRLDEAAQMTNEDEPRKTGSWTYVCQAVVGILVVAGQLLSRDGMGTLNVVLLVGGIGILAFAIFGFVRAKRRERERPR